MEYQSPRGHVKIIALIIILILAISAGVGYSIIRTRTAQPAASSAASVHHSPHHHSSKPRKKASHLTQWEQNRQENKSEYSEAEGLNMSFDNAYPRLASEALYWLIQQDSDERTTQLSLRFKGVREASYGFARFPWDNPPFTPESVKKISDSAFECTTTVDSQDHYTVTLHFEKQSDGGWAITAMTTSPGAIAAPNPEGT